MINKNAPQPYKDPFASPVDKVVSPLNRFFEKGVKAYFASGYRCEDKGIAKSITAFFDKRPGVRAATKFGVYGTAVVAASSSLGFLPVAGTMLGMWATNATLYNLHRHMPGTKPDGSPILTEIDQKEIRESFSHPFKAKLDEWKSKKETAELVGTKLSMNWKDMRQYLPVFMRVAKQSARETAFKSCGLQRGEGLMGTPTRRFAVYTIAGAGLVTLLGPATMVAAVGARWVNAKLDYGAVPDFDSDAARKEREDFIEHLDQFITKAEAHKTKKNPSPKPPSAP